MITKIIDFWWEWLTAMTLQVSLLVLLIGVVCFFWHKVSARFHYFLWLLILVKLVLPPDLGHKYSVFNLIAKNKGVLQYAPTLTKQSQEYIMNKRESSVPDMSSGFLENLTLVEMANMNFGVDTKSLSKLETQNIASLQTATLYIKHLINSIPYKYTLFSIWLLGIIGFLIPMILNLRRFHRWLLICGQKSPRWLEEKIMNLSGEIGIKKSPQCIIIPDTFSPCIFGWFKPKLLFPEDLLTQLNSEQLRMAILHELIHIKRRDTIISGIQSLIQILYWFNPLIWIAGREIRHHREMAVDEVVVATQNDLPKHCYEGTILKLSERRAMCSIPAVVGILEPHSFMFRRIVRLLDFSSNTISRRSSILGYLILLLFAVIMIPMGISQSETAQSEKEKIEQKGFLENLNESQKLYVEWTENTFAQLLDESKYKNLSDSEKAKLEGEWLKIIQEGPFDYKYYEAINGLGTIKSRKAVKPLLKVATERQEKNNRDRWMAVRALGMIGGSNDLVVPELIHLVYHPNQNTRFWAQISLARLTGVNFGDDWKKWGEWWNSKAIVVNLPTCSFEKVEWTTNSEWADPQKQKENDIAFIEKLKAGRKEVGAVREPSLQKAQEPSQKEEVNYLGQKNFPKVVELDPPNGAKDVDPNREHITVTFDRPMRGGYSWVDKGKRPPLEKIEWINDKQCRAWVKLEPNKEYGVWLNFGPNTSKFRNQEGISAERVYWEFSTKPTEKELGAVREQPLQNNSHPASDGETQEKLVTNSASNEASLSSRDLVKLSYVDDTAEGKQSIGASGHSILFERPEKAHFVESVEIFASRYGYPEAPKEDFHLYLLNEKFQILSDLQYPYGMIERTADLRWYTLKTPSIEVPEKFYVALSFNPHQTKGVYLGFDNSVKESHSFIGLPDSGYEKVKDKYDWMVRVNMTSMPNDEKNVQRLSGWKAPVVTNPFELFIEVKFDTGVSEGIQSYGGRGPAIRFYLNEFIPQMYPYNTFALKGLRLYASRYGSGYIPEQTFIKVYIFNKEGKVYREEKVPYALFSYKEKWVDIVFTSPIPVMEITDNDGSITIAIDPEAHQTKGIYFHYNKNPKISHSLAGNVSSGFTPLTDREWMIRAYFAVTGGSQPSALQTIGLITSPSPNGVAQNLLNRAEGSSKEKKYAEVLKQKVSLDIEKSPGNESLTVQYAVIAICEKAGIPYQWEKSQKYASPECTKFIGSVQIKDIEVEKALMSILTPVGLKFEFDGNGLYLCK